MPPPSPARHAALSPRENDICKATHGASPRIVDGTDETALQYVGMQGDHSHDKREAVNATYELLCQGHGTTAEADFKMQEGL